MNQISLKIITNLLKITFKFFQIAFKDKNVILLKIVYLLSQTPKILELFNKNLE